MSIYIDESLNVFATVADSKGVPLERLIQALGERLNPGNQGDALVRKRVDEARLKLLGASVGLLPYGTVVFGPEDELADRQHAAIQFDERPR